MHKGNNIHLNLERFYDYDIIDQVKIVKNFKYDKCVSYDTIQTNYINDIKYRNITLKLFYLPYQLFQDNIKWVQEGILISQNLD